MRTFILAASLLALALPAQAQTPPPAKREKLVTVFGQEACPKSTDPENEIIVCNRRPPDEQFRIPAGVRNETSIARKDQVGANRQALADESIAPTSCTSVGISGQYGCSQGINILGAAKAAKAIATGDTPVPDPAPQP